VHRLAVVSLIVAFAASALAMVVAGGAPWRRARDA